MRSILNGTTPSVQDQPLIAAVNLTGVLRLVTGQTVAFGGGRALGQTPHAPALRQRFLRSSCCAHAERMSDLATDQANAWRLYQRSGSATAITTSWSSEAGAFIGPM